MVVPVPVEGEVPREIAKLDEVRRVRVEVDATRFRQRGKDCTRYAEVGFVKGEKIYLCTEYCSGNIL